jgi:hypothetical protein
MRYQEIPSGLPRLSARRAAAEKSTNRPDQQNAKPGTRIGRRVNAPGVNTMHHSDPLGAARGCLNAIAITIVLCLLIGIVFWFFGFVSLNAPVDEPQSCRDEFGHRIEC